MGYEPRSLFKKLTGLFDRPCFNQKTDILEPGIILHNTPLAAEWQYMDILNPSRNTKSTSRNSLALLSKV